MRFLMLPVGSVGDLLPHVGIARALQRRGHDVTVVTLAYHRELVARAGLQAVPIGRAEDYRETLAHPDLHHPRRGVAVAVEMLRRQVPEFVRAVRECAAAGPPPVLVAHSLSFVARAARDAANLPLATLHLQPTCFLSAEAPPVPDVRLASMHRWPRFLRRLYVKMADTLADRALAPLANDYCAAWGQPKARSVIRRWWHSPDLTVGLFPPWYAPPQSDWPAGVRLTGFPLFDAPEPAATPQSDALNAWLDQGDPPVVFVAGTGNLHAAQFFRSAVDACAARGRRALLLTRFDEQVPSRLPEGIRHADYAPLSEVLPRAAAIVHHGGVGTLAQALRAGVPQLVMPLSFDQPDNAIRLERLGVGRHLAPSAFGADSLGRSLEGLLESEDVRRACRSVASRFAGKDPVADTCDLLESLG